MQPVKIPKVLFILGAGSSNGLGFPLGDELKGELLVHLTPGNNLYTALLNSGLAEAEVKAFARQLQRAEFDTIDHHLREINDPVTREIGKRAVAYLIRMKESEDALFHTGRKARHWYKIFADHLAQFRDHASASYFSFITYNYDRSLPHYLYETLSSRKVPPPSLRIFLGEPNFFHVHGHVGELPWHLGTGGDSKAYYQYGASLAATDLAGYLPNIMLPDDERETGLLLPRIIGDAEVVAFIGFGFHDSNMRLLPFGAGAPLSPAKRKFYSINPFPPPSKIIIEGHPIRHLKGKVDEVISEFFSDLVSGLLVLDEPPLREIKIDKGDDAHPRKHR